MNNNVCDVLCNQVINVALVVKEFDETPIRVSSAVKVNVIRFINRINSVLSFVEKLFVDYNANRIDDDFVNDKMCELLNTLVNYKNSYKKGNLSYRYMNSLLDIVTEAFVELNNK